jgi:hypothetical protein
MTIIFLTQTIKNNLFNLTFYSEDLGKTMTIKAFFIQLLSDVWIEKECFDGKRPFGNSYWERDILACLIKNKAFLGTFDADGYIDEYNSKAFEKFVLKEIIQKM